MPAANEAAVDAVGGIGRVAGFHQDRQDVVGIVAGAHSALDQVGEERIGEDDADRWGDEQSDDAGATRGEAAGGGIGNVVPLGNDRFDSLARSGAHPRVAIDDP